MKGFFKPSTSFWVLKFGISWCVLFKFCRILHISVLALPYKFCSLIIFMFILCSNIISRFKDPMNWSCNFWHCKMDSLVCLLVSYAIVMKANEFVLTKCGIGFDYLIITTCLHPKMWRQHLSIFLVQEFFDASTSFCSRL